MDETPSLDDRTLPVRATNILRRHRLAATLLAIVLLFFCYIEGLSRNPPGFYIDESAISYNAYLIAHTGAGESGTRFPLFIPVYTGGWTQYANPTQIYLLAVPFSLVHPSIWKARVFSAAWVFAACLLLGFLARQVSGQPRIGAVVAVIALLTPWLFEVSRLVFETYFYPMALVLFLLAVYYAQRRDIWNWLNVGTLAVTLTLVTYTYTIGRLLGGLMALGLVLFATTKQRLFGVVKTWLVYGLTLIPLMVFNWRHPNILTQRFYLISYIKPQMPWREIAPKFIRRYLEDFSLISLLIDGDINPRHHVTGALGSFFVAVFILAIIGLVVVVVRHWREPWWRFIVFGLAVSIVPGALTADRFHTLRLIAYPVFLLTLTIPALEFLLERPPEAGSTLPLSTEAQAEPQERAPSRTLSPSMRRVVLAVLLTTTALEAIYFQSVFRSAGPLRRDAFDAPYKEVYDAATALPNRPIYLIDGMWGPAYEHAYWYALLEGRNRAELVHLDQGRRAPPGALVISSEERCTNCRVIQKSGVYLLYQAL